MATIIQQLRKIEKTIISSQEKAYFECALKFLENDYAEKVTYCSGDNISFTLWGMNMRKGRAFETVIKDEVREHRVHTVTYSVQGKGIICGSTSILRKHGHILQGSKDIPEIKVENHFAFIEWIPYAPQGKPVECDIDFIALEKGEIEPSKVANDLINAMDQYANYGFYQIYERLRQNTY